MKIKQEAQLFLRQLALR